MNKIIALILLLLPTVGQTRLKDSAAAPKKYDCIYQGKFSAFEIIKINGKELEPVSLSVGRFVVSKIKEAKSSACSKTISEFDIIFSNGHGNGSAWGEACTKPFKTLQEYEVSLNIEFEGTLIPADCYHWIRTLM